MKYYIVTTIKYYIVTTIKYYIVGLHVAFIKIF